MIRFENVSKSFWVNGRRTTVFDDLSFTLPSGKALALLGRNGAGKSTLLQMVSGIMAHACYSYENFRFDGESIFTNKIPSGAFRGYGNPQQALVVEQMIEKMCADLGLDSLEWRRKWHRQGGEDIHGFGVPTMNCGVEEVLETSLDNFDWYGKREQYANQTGTKRRGG